MKQTQKPILFHLSMKRSNPDFNIAMVTFDVAEAGELFVTLS